MDTLKINEADSHFDTYLHSDLLTSGQKFHGHENETPTDKKEKNG